MDRSNNPHETKVQFAEGINDLDHNSDIQVQVSNQFVVRVHLGFLQVNHKYEIKFVFECSESMENIFDLKNYSTNNIQIIELKILRDQMSDVKTISFKHNVTAHLFAYKEKFLKESISLQADNSSKVLTFIFNARVLGRDKGTPLLKNGIQSIEYNTIDDNLEER